MQELNGILVYSPSDVSDFLACSHLAQQKFAVARGASKPPIFADPYADLIREKGIAHEKKYLEDLRAKGKSVVEITRGGGSPGELEAARIQTEAAIVAGTAEVIYQPFLTDGTWRGFADFLERAEGGGYEPVDTKLARTARSEHILQLCFYAEQLGRIQGRQPEMVHVQLGSGERESFRTADFQAYYRRAQKQLQAAVNTQPATYPWPCEHCAICNWRRECNQRLVDDDNLVLVAGLGRAEVERLETAGISTLKALGEAPSGTPIEDMRPESFEALRHQAELQLAHRMTGNHRTDVLPLEEGKGFHLMPEPSPGDVWFDIEGHPFFETSRGLEYLFGYCYKDESRAVQYKALWAKDSESERLMFEEFVDWVVARRAEFPTMHVYHYANYERSALTRLMGEHGTREQQIDDLLRGDVLVDLYRVTRQALRASVESYSIKKIEALYGFVREADVRGGNESTVLFEQWLACGENDLLDEIRAYNEDDCRSTVELHKWLIGLRPNGLPWRQPQEAREMSEDAQAYNKDLEALRAELLQRSNQDGDAPWLLSQLLDYHRREAKPQWWEWFTNLQLGLDELLRSTTALAGLTPIGNSTPDKKSLVYRFQFPGQDHKIHGGGVDPATQKLYKDIQVDDERGELVLRRAANRAGEPLPRALIPGQPLSNKVQQDAIVRFARSYLSGGGAYAGLADVLEQQLPRVDLSLQPADAALTLDRSYLLVQGPPGAGKTWHGAKMAVALMQAGRRVGVLSLSHKAINNLLQAIEQEAERQQFTFRGRKKHSSDEQAHNGRCIDSSDDNADLTDSALQLLAGTSWLFARPEFDQKLDVLFIDEAGQMSLADVIACGTSAKSLILLGDPNQLPQVSQGSHPEAAKASALQHLLGEHATVPADRGIFLAETWRLRPELCEFTSEAYYDGRLRSAPICATRSLKAGDGPKVLPVLHEGRSQSSREEAEAVADEARRLIGSEYSDGAGSTRPLRPEDVLVVAPYNAQVRLLLARVPAGVRVGTVDKFQGQEAPVVIVSFASSSAEDSPRGIQFAFDRHRVNVATSRGQCRVVLVLSPRLLDADCRTTDQLRLINSACRFTELAT